MKLRLQIKFWIFFQIAALIPTLIRVLGVDNIGGLSDNQTLKLIIEIVLQIVFISIGSYLTTRILLSRPLDRLKHIMNRAESGDMSTIASIKTNDEMQDLGDTFDSMLVRLKDVFSQVTDAAEKLAGASVELASASAESTSRIEVISKTTQNIKVGSTNSNEAIENTSASIQEMTASAQLIASNSQTASQDSGMMNTLAEEGGESVNRAVRTMMQIKTAVSSTSDVIEKLNDSSKQIGNIVGTITAIAEQTNLLALNAAIEAARAGDAGRGFAVVADEVSRLAEESATAADEVTNLVKEIQTQTEDAVKVMHAGTTKVDEGVDRVNEAGKNLGNIMGAVTKVSDMIEEISKSALEQSNNSNQISKAAEDLSKVARETSDGTQEVSNLVEHQIATFESLSASAEELRDMASHLQGIMDSFKLGEVKGIGVVTDEQMNMTPSADEDFAHETQDQPEEEAQGINIDDVFSFEDDDNK